MNEETNPSGQVVVAAFLDKYTTDLAARAVRSLESYQALYPGFEALIAREFEQLSKEGAEDRQKPLSTLATVGPYRILRAIGRGGQGEVYLAEDTRLGRKVALKILHRLGCASTDTIARFHREGEIASRLDHPGLATVYETGVSDGVPYIAMRYVAGESLADRIRIAKDASTGPASTAKELTAKGRTSKEDSSTSSAPVDRTAMLEIVGIIERAARALHVAHGAGIIHRDVKPGNILITDEGTPVILDFGLARELEGDRALTRSGELFGTPDYMSPEQLTAHRVPLDHRTDVYSLAVTLFECLTLCRPFESPTRERLYQAILGKEPPNVRKLNTAVPPDLKVVLETALEKDRDRRYQTADDFADELARVCRNEPIRARPIGWGRRFGRWIEREPAKAAAMLLAFVLAGAAGYLTHAWPGISADRRLAEEVRRAERVERLLETSYVEVDKGDTEDALGGFFEVLELEPDSAVAVAGVGIAYGRLGRRAEMLEFLEKNQAVIDRHPNLNWLLAIALRGVGRADEADALIRKPVTVKSDVDHFLAATRLIHRGHTGFPEAFRRAVSHLRQALLLTSRTPALYHFALAHALGHVADPQSCRDVADSLAQLYPESPEADFWRGFALAHVDHAAAIEAFRTALERRPEFPAASMNLGCALYGDEQYDAALSCLRTQLGRDVDDAGAHYHIGKALLLKGDAAGAIEAFDQALKAKPDNSKAYFHLGSARDDLGDTDGALVAYRAALANQPHYPSAHFNIAGVLQRSGKLDEAVTAFRRAIRQTPKNHRLHYFLGNALRDQGDLDGALRAYGQSLRLEPDYFDALINNGTLLNRRNEFKAAKRVFERAVEKWPKSPTAHDGLGGAQLGLRELKAAIRSHQKAVELKPDYARYRHNLGLAHLKGGDLDQALDALTAAFERDPALPETSYAIGRVHMIRREYDRAIPHYKTAVRLRSGYSPAQVNLAVCLDYAGQSGSALSVLEQAVRDAPRFMKAWYSLGIVRARKGDRAGAIAAYEETVRLAPRYVEAWTNLGIELNDRGDRDRAIDALERALRIRPGFSKALHGLGRTLLAMGRPSAALALHQQALRKNPKDSHALFGCGRCFETLHRYREAREALERAHRLGRAVKGWRQPAPERVAAYNRRAALEEKLDGVIVAELEPADAGEHVDLAVMAADKKRYLLAVALWDALLDDDPPLGDVLKGKYRHHAARASLLAAAGKGVDAFQLDDKQRIRLRRRAITMLEADLAAWKELNGAGKLQTESLVRLLETWKEDPILAVFRDSALAEIPAEDRDRCVAFWANVDAIIDR